MFSPMSPSQVLLLTETQPDVLFTAFNHDDMITIFVSISEIEELLNSPYPKPVLASPILGLLTVLGSSS